MALYCSPDYQINWTFSSGEEVQNRYPRQLPWHHLGFLIRTILALFYLQVTPMLPTKFGVSWSFGSGEEGKTKFLRWQPWWPSWISNQNDFSYFDLLVTRCFLSSFKTTVPMFQEKKQKIDFQDGSHGGQLAFPTGTILAISYLQVTPMLSTKFHVNSPLSSGEETKDSFYTWRSWWPAWILDLINFSYFWCTSHPNASYQVSNQLAFRIKI